MRIEKVVLDIPVVAYRTLCIYTIHENDDEDDILDKKELTKGYEYDDTHKHVLY